MAPLFCCGDVKPYKAQRLQHDAKFSSFMAWASANSDVEPTTDKVDLTELKPILAIQLVRQVNYGPLESKRYFVPANEGQQNFMEVTENDLIQANFQKLNT